MYVEMIARRGTEVSQLQFVQNVAVWGDSAAGEPRIVVVFTTASDTAAALRIARDLAISDTRIRLVCP